MARKAILDTYYQFTPSTRQIIIPRPIQQERLVLITDLATNQVIYNFSDPNLKTTSYVVGPDVNGLFAAANATTITTLTLQYNTTALTATDKLQILIDEYDEKFTPSESYLDPINKLRTSTPQNLIDTDYEYSIQTTKWEQLALLNNRPYAYYVTATGNIPVIDVQAVNGSKTYTANTTGTLSPAIGTPFFITDTLYAGADGLYIVDSNNNPLQFNTTGTSNTFTYTGKYYYTGTTGSIYNQGVTIGYSAGIFSGANIALSTASVTGNIVTVSTSTPHGLHLGNEIAMTGASTANGSFGVSTIISPYTFQYNTTGASFTPTAGAVTLTNAALYVRPQGLALHRPFDGGVRFSTNASSHNQQYVRQTRKYFRYQSGKGIQMSTGTTLKPQFNIDSITASGTVITVTTKDPHNIAAAMSILVSGCNETPYNGIFTVTSVLSPYQFTYTSATTPLNPVASGAPYVSANSWYGGTNRVGIFDSQNGMFWEYDGITLSAVKRSSTYQIGGQITVGAGSSLVTANTGFPTYFNKQLTTGDFVVIKGMTYRVNAILSDSQMLIQPPYRGNSTLQNATVSRTVDIRVPQNQFNIDRLDGTGPSGYTIDLTKMQMFYIDYSWYGAGFIRFGVRGPTGDVVYCHKIINNNVNYLAYMRSGNLPARYETNTFSKVTYMTGGASGIGTNLNATDTTVYVANTSGFPTTGTVWIRNANTGGNGWANSEFVNYTGLTSNTLTGLIRANMVSTLSTTATTVTGNAYLTSVASMTGVQPGQLIYGGGIPSGAFVQSIPNSTTIVMNYTAVASGTGTTIQIAPMSNVAQTFLFSTTAQTAIELHSPNFSPEINHWGTSAIMDGGYTPDKSFIFTRGMPLATNVSSGSTQAVMSFRIAPTVSNGITSSQLGVREIVNRMQQVPYETDMYANGSFLITCVLNGKTSNTAEQWLSVGGSSLSQYIFHNPGTTISGGEPVFGFFLNTQGTAGSAAGLYATTQQDLSQLLALGSSILSGGSANAATNIYPDGPDVLTFVAQNIGSSANASTIQARYSWTEAQA